MGYLGQVAGRESVWKAEQKQRTRQMLPTSRPPTHGRRDNKRRPISFPVVFKAESTWCKVLATWLQELRLQNDPLKISRI